MRPIQRFIPPSSQAEMTEVPAMKLSEFMGECSGPGVMGNAAVQNMFNHYTRG